jgi:hypothetical protein
MAPRKYTIQLGPEGLGPGCRSRRKERFFKKQFSRLIRAFNISHLYNQLA